MIFLRFYSAEGTLVVFGVLLEDSFVSEVNLLVGESGNVVERKHEWVKKK